MTLQKLDLSVFAWQHKQGFHDRSIRAGSIQLYTKHRYISLSILISGKDEIEFFLMFQHFTVLTCDNVCCCHGS